MPPDLGYELVDDQEAQINEGEALVAHHKAEDDLIYGVTEALTERQIRDRSCAFYDALEGWQLERLARAIRVEYSEVWRLIAPYLKTQMTGNLKATEVIESLRSQLQDEAADLTVRRKNIISAIGRLRETLATAYAGSLAITLAKDGQRWMHRICGRQYQERYDQLALDDPSFWRGYLAVRDVSHPQYRLSEYADRRLTLDQASG